MAGVYLGDSGLIELKRTSNNAPLLSRLDPDDVNVPRKRFSFDFDPDALITGDRIEIATADGSTLELVAGHAFPDGSWYCHVDDAGGVRLYNSFGDALNGEETEALALMAPVAAQEITVTNKNTRFRCVAGMTQWSLTTNRDAIDLTTLGEDHRRFYSNGLMSGQGSLRCLWDYDRALCGDNSSGDRVELAHYFAQLVLRVRLGAEFQARFVLKSDTAGPVNARRGAGATAEALWWEANAIVTNVGMDFAPGTVLATQVEFVTTGPIHLRMGQLPAYLLQENGNYLLQENGDRLLLEDD